MCTLHDVLSPLAHGVERVTGPDQWDQLARAWAVPFLLRGMIFHPVGADPRIASPHYVSIQSPSFRSGQTAKAAAVWHDDRLNPPARKHARPPQCRSSRARHQGAWVEAWPQLQQQPPRRDDPRRHASPSPPRDAPATSLKFLASRGR